MEKRFCQLSTNNCFSLFGTITIKSMYVKNKFIAAVKAIVDDLTPLRQEMRLRRRSYRSLRLMSRRERNAFA